MAPFINPQEPVALPGEAIRLEPANEVRKIKAIEQLGRIGPVDYGAVNSGQTTGITNLEDELEMNDNQLGQFLVNPLSLVEVEIRQTGDQDQRFVNKNQVGVITPHDPANQRLVWVLGTTGIAADITNRQTWDMAKTLVYYTGFKYVLEPGALSRGAVEQLPGEPASVPIDSLKKSPEEASP